MTAGHRRYPRGAALRAHSHRPVLVDAARFAERSSRPAGGGGADPQLSAVFGHGAPRQRDPLLFQQLAEGLVAERVGGILVLEMQH